METIAPLLQLNPGEVLINFMTEHIRRFIESPQRQTQESFMKLFGSSQFKDELKGLGEKDREDAIVMAYSESVKRVGAFGSQVLPSSFIPQKIEHTFIWSMQRETPKV